MNSTIQNLTWSKSSRQLPSLATSRVPNGVRHLSTRLKTGTQERRRPHKRSTSDTSTRERASALLLVGIRIG
eukprot:1270564-Pyramimonas_sp.AAC.1